MRTVQAPKLSQSVIYIPSRLLLHGFLLVSKSTPFLQPRSRVGNRSSNHIIQSNPITDLHTQNPVHVYLANSPMYPLRERVFPTLPLSRSILMLSRTRMLLLGTRILAFRKNTKISLIMILSPPISTNTSLYRFIIRKLTIKSCVV
jgi:hypothetical protein